MPRPGEAPQPQFKRGKSLAYGQATAGNRGLADVPDFQPSGEEEEFLYGPTDRPGEPVTAGAPFGPGPDVPSRGPEGPQEFLQRVAQTLPTNASPEVQKFIAKVSDRAARGL